MRWDSPYVVFRLAALHMCSVNYIQVIIYFVWHALSIEAWLVPEMLIVNDDTISASESRS